MALVILAINVLVYGIMVVSTGEFDWDADELLHWGGNLGALSLHAEPWRLLTSCYLHAGFQHILGNMFLLMVTGIVASVKIGQIRFLGVYTLCGIAAELLAAWAHPDGVSVGASGAIAGVVGVLVVLAASGRCKEVSGRWLLQIVVMNAAYSFAPGVDGVAHLGGFAAGLALGLVLLAIPGGVIELPTKEPSPPKV